MSKATGNAREEIEAELARLRAQVAELEAALDLCEPSGPGPRPERNGLEAPVAGSSPDPAWAGRALRESEERLQTILDFVHAGVVVIDPAARRIRVANPAACKLIGLPGAHIVGRTCHQFLCPAEEGRCPVLDLGQDVDNAERTLLTADGRSLPVLMTATRITLDGRPHLLECFMDLSGRRHAEQVFRGVAESVSDAIFLNGVDDEGLPDRFLEVNPAACHSLGYSREELLGMSAMEITDPEVCREVWPKVLADLFTKGWALFETVHLARDGRRIPVETHAQLLGGETRDTVLSVARDISARKTAEDALRRARDAAEAASRAKTEFLANLSHELRTPLNGILGMLQLLRDAPLPEEGRQFADIALQSAQGMLNLVNDLLDLTCIEAGKVRLAAERCDLRELLNSVCKVFDLPARAKGLALVCTLHPGLPDTVLCDQARLRQVLFNLVGNAVKFTESGKVLLEASALPDGDSFGPRRILFCVSDTGIGIPEHMQQEVFNPFTQADGSSVRRHGGVGLGLAISRRLVQLMGGNMSVDSAPGRGATICFTAPLRTPPAQPAAEPGQAAPRLPLRVLLAEDEPINRLAARLMLEKLGHSVACAADGTEALAMLARDRFDCVLMDIEMPEPDGLAVLRRLRALEEGSGLSRTPVLAMTAHAMAGDRERFIQAGFNGYMAKPVDMDRLDQAMRRIAALPGNPAPAKD